MGSFFFAEIALNEVPPLPITLHRVFWGQIHIESSLALILIGSLLSMTPAVLLVDGAPNFAFVVHAFEPEKKLSTHD